MVIVDEENDEVRWSDGVWKAKNGKEKEEPKVLKRDQREPWCWEHRYFSVLCWTPPKIVETAYRVLTSQFMFVWKNLSLLSCLCLVQASPKVSWHLWSDWAMGILQTLSSTNWLNEEENFFFIGFHNPRSQLSPSLCCAFLRWPTALREKSTYWYCAGYGPDNAASRFEPFLWKYSTHLSLDSFTSARPVLIEVWRVWDDWTPPVRPSWHLNRESRIPNIARSSRPHSETHLYSSSIGHVWNYSRFG